jgi:hypothetical protein
MKTVESPLKSLANFFTNKNLWVETDLEPDDVLAIDILQRKGYTMHTIVCGEGKEKVNRCLAYYDKTVPNIVKGHDSNKDFPEPAKYKNYVSSLTYSTNYKEQLKSYLESNTKLVIMKPPRELFEMFLADRESTKQLLKNVTCYMYGSFNIRSLKADKKDVLEFLNSFGNLYYYESYRASGSCNSVSSDTYANFSKLKACDNFYEIMDAWDDYILKDCIDTCNSITGKSGETLKTLDEYVNDGDLSKEFVDGLSQDVKGQYDRNYKCYVSVVKNKGQQFVLADVGLALCIDKAVWDRVSLDFNDAGYTVYTENPTGNTCSVNGIGIDTLKLYLDELYE